MSSDLIGKYLVAIWQIEAIHVIYLKTNTVYRSSRRLDIWTFLRVFYALSMTGTSKTTCSLIFRRGLGGVKETRAQAPSKNQARIPVAKSSYQSSLGQLRGNRDVNAAITSNSKMSTKISIENGWGF